VPFCVAFSVQAGFLPSSYSSGAVPWGGIKISSQAFEFRH
jgi:hypothetical protein